MPLRPCLDCRAITSRTDSRCPTCASIHHHQRDQRRGGTTARSYGTAHQRERERLLPMSIGKPCPRCNEIMRADEQLDLGHSDGARKRAGLPGDRIEHAVCNRGER